MGFPTAFTTLHRWFSNTKSIATSVKHRVKTIIADGTGYKKKIDSQGSNRGEVKVVIGLTSDGELVPFGAWTRASWNDLANYIKRENHASEKIKFKPIAELLVTDGEEGLIRAMKKLANQHQRCLFHMTHEIGYLLKYKDNASQKESEDITDELARLIYLQVPELTADPLKNLEEKIKIEIEFNKVKKQLEEFIKTLKYMGYTKAKNFVENAKSQLYTYIESWLKTGDQNPKVTSLIERVMREIKRRIKKIGSGWSEAGAERMTRLILLRLSQTKNRWEDQWKSKLGTDADIKLIFLGVTSEI
jgi:transposase-like protein